MKRPTKLRVPAPRRKLNSVEPGSGLDSTLTTELHASFERLLHVSRSARRHAGFVESARVPGVGLTRGESFLLSEVIARGPLRLSDLAAGAGLDRSIASRQADALVRAGLVERAPDPSDGRAALLTPTQLGREVLERLQAERRRWFDRAVATLDPADIASLAALLPRLLEAIEASEVDTAGWSAGADRR